MSARLRRHLDAVCMALGALLGLIVGILIAIATYSPMIFGHFELFASLGLTGGLIIGWMVGAWMRSRENETIPNDQAASCDESKGEANDDGNPQKGVPVRRDPS